MSCYHWFICTDVLRFAGTGRPSSRTEGDRSLWQIMCIDFGRKWPTDWRLKCLIPLCAFAKLCIGNQSQLGLLRCHGQFSLSDSFCFFISLFFSTSGFKLPTFLCPGVSPSVSPVSSVKIYCGRPAFALLPAQHSVQRLSSWLLSEAQHMCASGSRAARS